MRLRSILRAGAAVAAAIVVPAHSLHAAPPTTRVVAAAAPPTALWINHEVVAGERLNEIADRYAVSTASIMRWNQLDANRPQFWVGEQLRVQTQLPDRRRSKLSYIVRANDTWAKIARRFSIDQEQLQRFWNPQEASLTAGHQLTIWVEPGTLEQEPIDELPFSMSDIPAGAVSAGRPDFGRLVNGVQIPMNPGLYTLRNMEHAWGSSHAISILQRGIAMFRARTGYEGEVIIWDMSVKRGGRFGPHRSHRTGRDVDIGIPMRPHTAASKATGAQSNLRSPDGTPVQADEEAAIDWEATWHLIRSFVETGEVRYVFLSKIRQASLYKAARACGATAEELDRLLQYPRTAKVGIVRDSPGHTGHLHVRFTCGLDEPDCQEL